MNKVESQGTLVAGGQALREGQNLPVQTRSRGKTLLSHVNLQVSDSVQGAEPCKISRLGHPRAPRKYVPWPVPQAPLFRCS